MSQTDYEKSCGICGMIPHHSKCRVRELETKLAEANAALLHMEADRDGCLKIMFSSQHGKEIRELQIEVTRLRSQLERSPCGHLVAEWVFNPNDSGEDDLVGQSGYCLACRIMFVREADAVRSGLEMAAKRVYELDDGEGFVDCTTDVIMQEIRAIQPIPQAPQAEVKE